MGGIYFFPGLQSWVVRLSGQPGESQLPVIYLAPALGASAGLTLGGLPNFF